MISALRAFYFTYRSNRVKIITTTDVVMIVEVLEGGIYVIGSDAIRGYNDTLYSLNLTIRRFHMVMRFPKRIRRNF